MSNKKVLITLSFVKNLIKQLNDPHAKDALKDSKQYCFDIPSGKQIFFRDLKLIGFALRAALLHKPICKGFFSDIIFK